MQDVDLGAPPSDPLIAETDEDCETTTTVSSGNDSQSVQPARKAIGDGKVSSVLSIGFIRSAEFLCLLESHLRNSCTLSGGAFSGTAKRKNSSEGVEEDDEEEVRASVLEGGRRPRRNQAQTVPLLVV